jgi:hypothetical protein
VTAQQRTAALSAYCAARVLKCLPQRAALQSAIELQLLEGAMAAGSSTVSSAAASSSNEITAGGSSRSGTHAAEARIAVVCLCGL